MTHVCKVKIHVFAHASGLLHSLIVHLWVKRGTRRQFSFWTRDSAGGAQDAGRFAMEVARE
eukprot:829132-Rhodomonas_salina.1